MSIEHSTSVAANEENVMHPVIAQAIAAEQVRELQAHAVAARQACQPRRSRHARLFPRLPDADHTRRPTARPLRGPRAA
jgi:hypothetical protein